MKFAAKQVSAEYGDKRDGDDCGADHRERFGEGQRMKELAFLPREREDRDEGEDDDRHREEDGTPDELR